MATEATKAQLVDQIKDIQRSDPDSKQAWWDYCDQYLGGIRDPSKHEPRKLSGFLAFFTRGARSVGASNAGAGVGASNGGASKGGKGGVGKGSWAKGAGGAGGWHGHSWSSWEEPPAAAAAGKGSSSTSGWGAGGWGSPWVQAPAAPAGAQGDRGSYSALHGGAAGPSPRDIVKSGQRASAHWRGAWRTYCAVYGNGVNDPARHDDAHIAGFIDYVGQAALTSLQAVAAERGVPLDDRPCGTGPAARPAAAQPQDKRAPVGSATAAAGTQAVLVDKIKALQRADPAANLAWWSHCDSGGTGTRDPDHHDKASLEAFLANYSAA